MILVWHVWVFEWWLVQGQSSVWSFTIKDMSYFGLHSVFAHDELGVSSSLPGQSINKCRTGPFSDSKRETPTIHLERWEDLCETVVPTCLFGVVPVGAWILLHQTDNFFCVRHLTVSKDKNLKRRGCIWNNFKKSWSCRTRVTQTTQRSRKH